MHEFSLIYSLLQIVLDSAAERGITQIWRVRLVIGQWYGALPEALTFAFDQLKAGTACARAQLEIAEGPGQELYVDYYEGE